MNPQEKLNYNICVMGGGGVGKSALTVGFCYNHFVEVYDPTIEDCHRRQVTIDEQIAYLELLDTAGQEEYIAMRPSSIRFGEGFVLVYAINDRYSFEEVSKFREEILKYKDVDEIPMILIGNKGDLERERSISKREGEDLAKTFGCPFLETSAKEFINIEQTFFKIVKEIRKFRNLKNPQQQIKKKRRRIKRCLLM